LKWTLPPDTLSPRPFDAFQLQFTSDGAHLIVVYGGDTNPDPNHFVVWDLATQTIVRSINFGYYDIPMAISPGDYAGAMWVASRNRITTDAGDYLSTVTLMDVAQATPAKAQVTLAGLVNAMAFSPDGTTLAMAFDSSEVSLWDITSKANIAKLGSSLVVGSSSSALSAYSLAYAPDGKYVAAGLGDFFGISSVNLTMVQQRTSLQKDIDFLPWSIAFAPDGLALAVGERDYGIIVYCRAH
jgi:WD40 repeat protein